VASVGGHFSDVNLSSALYIHRSDDPEHVKLEVWSAPGLSKPSFEEAMKQTFKPARKGLSLGPSWTNHWWKVSIKIPGYWSQYERVQFEFDPGCEAMILSTGKGRSTSISLVSGSALPPFRFADRSLLIRWHPAPGDHRWIRGYPPGRIHHPFGGSQGRTPRIRHRVHL
jgi:hypothetical protein